MRIFIPKPVGWAELCEAQQYKILFSQTIIILKPSSWQEKYLFRLTMNT
ncbi:hypothetical protein CbuG_1126 [Coxiella burnetii CbuG_Q212]|nr:hypothetical protein CbuG_1126 [Coxiella burnetii CbuG_Q212]